MVPSLLLERARPSALRCRPSGGPDLGPSTAASDKASAGLAALQKPVGAQAQLEAGLHGYREAVSLPILASEVAAGLMLACTSLPQAPW